MKIVLQQYVEMEKGGECDLLQKEVNSDLIPIAGCFIKDLLWDNGNKIEEVLLSFEDNCYYVTMKRIELSDEARMTINEYKDMAKTHGWK